MGPKAERAYGDYFLWALAGIPTPGMDAPFEYFIIPSREVTKNVIGESFDFVLDAVGMTSFFHCRKLLRPGGVFIVTDLGPWWQNLPLATWSSLTGSDKVVIPLPARGAGQVFVAFFEEACGCGSISRGHRSQVSAQLDR